MNSYAIATVSKVFFILPGKHHLPVGRQGLPKTYRFTCPRRAKHREEDLQGSSRSPTNLACTQNLLPKLCSLGWTCCPSTPMAGVFKPAFSPRLGMISSHLLVQYCIFSRSIQISHQSIAQDAGNQTPTKPGRRN